MEVGAKTGIGDEMSRFELYGGNDCGNCVYFVRADNDKWQTPRCTHESNMYDNWLGVAFHKRPEAINMYKRCPNYEER